MKTILLFMFIVAGHFCFGQAHDENFRSGDPLKSVQVYPNPATDYVNIKFETPIAKSSKLTFYSIIGSSIELEQEVIDDFEVRIKVKDIPVGYYVIAIVDLQSNAKAIHKFLKK